MSDVLPRAYSWYALGLLALMNLLSFVNRNIVFALFDPIKRDLHLTDAQLGWLASAYVLVFALAALPFGLLGDLRSRRGVIAGGVLLWSAFTVVSGFASNFGGLLVARALVGAGGAAFGGAAQSLAADYFPSRGRAVAMGILAAGITLGGVGGIWLGGHLEAAYGWRAAFIAVSLPGFILAGIAARLRDPVRPQGVVSIAAALGELDLRLTSLVRQFLPLGELAASLTLVLRTRTLVYVFVGGAFISFGVNGLVGWAPTFMARELELSVARAATLLGTWGLLAGVGGALCGGLVADSLRRYTSTGRVLTVALGLLIGGPLSLWLLTVRDLTLFVPVFCAAFFFISWYSGPIAAVIFDVVPARISATVAGAYLLFIHLVGDTVAFPLVGFLSDRFGLDRAVLVLPSVALAGGMIILGAVGTVAQDMARATAEAASG